MRYSLMVLVGLVLAACAPVPSQREIAEFIRISDTGSIHGEAEFRLYPDNVLVESGWEIAETSYGFARKNSEHVEELRQGAFLAVLEFLRDHPFEIQETDELPEPCLDSPTIVIAYISENGGGFEYTAPCWDDDIGPYRSSLLELIGQYRD